MMQKVGMLSSRSRFMPSVSRPVPRLIQLYEQVAGGPLASPYRTNDYAMTASKGLSPTTT